MVITKIITNDSCTNSLLVSMPTSYPSSRAPPFSQNEHFPNTHRTLTEQKNEPHKNSFLNGERTFETPEFKRISPMNDTAPYIETNAQTYTERTYTAQQIAEENNVTDATVRNRWFTWICKVAPPALLKQGKSYTELAHTLFNEFAKVDKSERIAWVADAKARYSSEWGSVGVIDCEVMPDVVGGTLALLQTNLQASNNALSLELAEVTDFIGQLNAVDADYSQAELETWAANGAKKSRCTVQNRRDRQGANAQCPATKAHGRG